MTPDQLLGLGILALVLGILVYLIPVVGIIITGMLILLILVARYPRPARAQPKEEEKPGGSVQPSEEEKDETEELIREDSEGDGLVMMGDEDILFPPELDNEEDE